MLLVSKLVEAISFSNVAAFGGGFVRFFVHLLPERPSRGPSGYRRPFQGPSGSLIFCVPLSLAVPFFLYLSLSLTLSSSLTPCLSFSFSLSFSLSLSLALPLALSLSLFLSLVSKLVEAISFSNVASFGGGFVLFFVRWLLEQPS